MDKYKFVKITVDDFKSLYKVIENSFPSIERRNYEEQKKLFDDELYNVIGYKDADDRVGAFLAFWKFEDFNFIEHFAVDYKLRGNGMGTELFNRYLSSDDKMTILEVELPKDEISEKRIKYYEKMGMILNDYEYMQPPLQKGKPLLPLMVMSYKNELKSHEFKKIKEQIYKTVYKY
ncbi:GNAT family N-acetyltransferase [uncultured Clostridium sp.]|uniref:GNAT family N-acetyltransferase n=1 Tax=uncultured Clostridium sp. TaxID=59620 RepID=UPI0025FED01D|nr:GNAT family N-acetyltransferase [uncultured Clostridium sp.]